MTIRRVEVAIARNGSVFGLRCPEGDDTAPVTASVGDHIAVSRVMAYRAVCIAIGVMRDWDSNIASDSNNLFSWQ